MIFLVLRWFEDSTTGSSDFGGVIGVFDDLDRARSAVYDDSHSGNIASKGDLENGGIVETCIVDDRLNYTITKMQINKRTTEPLKAS